MKILQIAYNSDIAGGEKVLLNIVNGLRERHDFQVVVPDRKGELNDILARLGIPYHVIPVRKTYDLKSAIRLYRLLKSEEFDVVNSHGLLVNIVARIAVFLYRMTGGTKTRLFNTVHLTHQYGDSDRLFLYYYLIDLLTCIVVDATVCVSRGVRKYVRTFMPFLQNVHVVTNGIDESEIDRSVGTVSRRKVRDRLLKNYNRGSRKCDFLVVSVCRLSVQKNPFFLIEVARSMPDTLFLVIGDGFLRGELLERSKKLQNIVFLGYRKNAFRYISVCDVFFLPSLWEGFPLTILEAGYLKKASVVSNIPGNNEIIIDGHNGYLCHPHSVDDCVRKIGLLLSDKSDNAGETARRIYLERFTLDRQLDDLESLYLRTRHDRF